MTRCVTKSFLHWLKINYTCSKFFSSYLETESRLILLALHIAKVAFKEDIWLICLKSIPFYLFQVMADAMHQLTRYRDALLLKVQGPSKNTEIIAQCHLVQPHIPEEKN